MRAYMVGDIWDFHVYQPGRLLNLPMIADQANCSSFGTTVSRKMDSLSTTLIHEFMHWNLVGDMVPNSVGHIRDVSYGPHRCKTLAQDKANNQKTFVNADSYKYMAINAYYNSVCNTKFGDPVFSLQEYFESEIELRESPEYSAAG